MENFLKFWFLMNYCKLIWFWKSSTFMCLDTYGCLKWWNVFIFSEYKSLVVLTPCVTLSCFLGHLVLWPKYNVIISKSKTLLELELKYWFRVDCDFIIQIPLYSYIIMVWSILLKTWKTIIWVSTLVHSIMFSPIFPKLWKISNSLSTHIGK